MNAFNCIFSYCFKRLMDFLGLIPGIRDKKLDAADRLLAIGAHVLLTVMFFLMWHVVVTR